MVSVTSSNKRPVRIRGCVFLSVEIAPEIYRNMNGNVLNPSITNGIDVRRKRRLLLKFFNPITITGRRNGKNMARGE